ENTSPQPDGANQSSPLDTAQWPFGPVGAPSGRAVAPRVGSSRSQPAPPRNLPAAAIPRAKGPTSIGGPNGPAPLAPPARSGSRTPAVPAPAADPMLPPLRDAPEEPQNFGPFSVPPSLRSGVFSGADGRMAGTEPNAPISPAPGFGTPRASAPMPPPSM